MSADSSSPHAIVEAVVVGSVDYGESDRIVQLLTKLGRLSGFAPGAKKSRRRFQGALEPFATIEVDLHRGRRKGMPTLTSATVRKPRLGIRAELERIALASYLAELGLAVAPEGDPSEELYELVEGALDRVDDPQRPVSLAVRRAFELRLLDVLGYRPSLDRCTVSGERIEGLAYLDLRRGGLLRALDRGDARPVGPRTVDWMEAVLAQPAGTLDECAGLPRPWADRAALKLTGVFGDFFEHLLGRALKSEALLDNVRLMVAEDTD